MEAEGLTREELLAENARLRAALARGARVGAGESAPSLPSFPGDAPYLHLVDLLPDAVAIFVDEQLAYLNPAGLRLIGAATFEEVRGRPLTELVHPSDHEDVRERLRQLEAGEPPRLTRRRALRLDGSEVPVETASVPIRYGGRSALLTTARDLSARQQMEQALAESQRLFRTSFEASPAPLLITRLRDGRIVEANEAWCRLTGYAPPDALGRRTVDLGLWVHPEERGALLEQVTEEGAARDYPAEMQTRAGDRREVLVSLQRIVVGGEPCLLSVTTDVTEQQEVLRALQESEGRFRTLADAAPGMIWMADEEGRSTYFNARWLDFTGRPLDDEVGEGWIEAVHPDDRARVAATHRAHLARREAYRMEYRLRRHDGHYRWVLTTGVPRFVDDRFVGYVGSGLDISERKRSEQMLRRAKEQAEELARLRSVILSNITHEVRTPLTVILGFTSMLRQGVQPDYRRFVERIERSGRRLLLMLDAILDLAQLESNAVRVSRELFNVTDVVRAVAEQLRPVAEEKGLTFIVDAADDRVYVRLDHRILTRVLGNLLDNAIKFTDTGEVALRLEADEEQVHLHVEDTGIGIDADFLPHLFDEFSQESTGLERTHQGSGLGLSVSRRLVELMGGALDVRSDRGAGSTFTVTLPRNLDVAEPLRQPVASK